MATNQRQEFHSERNNAQRCVQVRTNGIVYGIGGRALAARWLWSIRGCFLLACGESTGIQSPHLIHLLQVFTDASNSRKLWRNNQKSVNFWRIKVQRAIIILVHTLYNRVLNLLGRYRCLNSTKMSEDPISPDSDLRLLLSKVRKDTSGWADALREQGFEVVQDLVEIELEDLSDILEKAGLSWNNALRNALRATLRNQAGLNLPSNWTFCSRAPASMPSNTTGGLARSNSVGSAGSSHTTKPLFGRQPHSGCKSRMIPRALTEFARLIGQLMLNDCDFNTICYLMALYHGLGLSLSPYPFEYTGMALALTRLFATQTMRQTIVWKTKLRSMFKNLRQGCYPRENPFPDHPLWNSFLLSKCRTPSAPRSLTDACVAAVRTPSAAAVRLIQCLRVPCTTIISVALGGYRMAFLLPMEAAAGGIHWMLAEVEHPIIALRNSIVPHSVVAEAQFNEADTRGRAEVEAEVAQMEADVIESRRDRDTKKKQELKARFSAFAYETCQRGGPTPWIRHNIDLKKLAQELKIKIGDLRKALISGDSRVRLKPYSGDAQPISIRQSPDFNLAEELARANGPQAEAANPQAEAAAPEAEAAAPEAEAAAPQAEAAAPQAESAAPQAELDELSDSDESSDSDGSDEVMAIIGQDDEDPSWFLVRWMTGDETYEPKSNLEGCWALVEEYLASLLPPVSEYEKAVVANRERNERMIQEIVSSQGGAAAPAEGDADEGNMDPESLDSLDGVDPDVPLPPPPLVSTSAQKQKEKVPLELKAVDVTSPLRDSMDSTPFNERLRLHTMDCVQPDINYSPAPKTPTNVSAPNSDLTMIVHDSDGGDAANSKACDRPVTTWDAEDFDVWGSPTPPPKSNKRAPISPADGTPSPSAAPPPPKVRSSPRFSKLPGAEPPPSFKVGDKVRAIWRYKDGGTVMHSGKITAAHLGGQHFTIKYKDGDVEENVTCQVMVMVKTRVLDSSPEC